jgi:hypothetical protein
MANTRKHDALGSLDESEVPICYDCFRAQMVQRPEHRGEITCLVVDYRYAHLFISEFEHMAKFKFPQGLKPKF